MQPDYETVVEAGSMITSGLPLLIHVGVVALEAAIASFLGIQGLLLLGASTGEVPPAAARFGFVSVPSERRRGIGAAALAVGLAFLVPLMTGAGVALTIAAIVSTAALVGVIGWGTAAGRRVRSVVVAAAIAVGLFALYEGHDPARQLREVASKALDWRQHEVDWQLEHDLRSPKVGDLAPDFELADTTGENSVRLAAFRGKRPVALVFGSYT